MHVRALEPTDINDVLRIERASFSTPWPRSVFDMAIEAPDLLALGAECGHELAGYAIATGDARELLLANIAVRHDRRRSGVATELLRQVLSWGDEIGAHRCRLEVRVSNRGAIELYRRHGFAPVAVQPAYYRFPTENALTMVRPFPDRDPATRQHRPHRRQYRTSSR